MWSVALVGVSGCGDRDSTASAPAPSEPGAELQELEPEPPPTPTLPVKGVNLRPRTIAPEASDEDQARAQELNRDGLRAHSRRNYTESLAKFVAAAEADPNLDHARFNAACAATRGGDLAAAREHLETFLRIAPGSVSRIFHDSDLDALRASEGFDAWLEAHMPEIEGAVRSIVFERRENGGDLYVVDETGFGERPLAVENDWREFRASVTTDGATVVYLASRFGREVPARQLGDGHPQRNWSDLDQQGRLYPHVRHHELRAIPFVGGAPRTVARRVHSYRLDGDDVLFVHETEGGDFELRSAKVEGGDEVRLAELEDAATWCYARRRDGSVLVAEGRQHQNASALVVSLSEYRDENRRELMPANSLAMDDPRVPDFQLCALSEDETQLHLGVMRITLTPRPRLRFLADLELGNGAYNFRRVGSQGFVDGDTLFLTVVGRDRGNEEYVPEAPFQLWQTSPLSWLNDNGMSGPWWYETQIVRTDWAGQEKLTLSPPRGAFEYAPAVRPDGEV
ncbi:MAG: hypothetical protein AAGF12_26965, partial [Myxococcota bacterium]